MDVDAADTRHVFHRDANGVLFEIAVGNAPDRHIAVINCVVNQIDRCTGHLFERLVNLGVQHTIIV